MSLRAPVGATYEYELPPAGMMVARCVAVYDLGTHLDPNFPKNDKGGDNLRHLVQIQFELDQLMDYNGEKVPMMSTLRLTLSSNEKAKLRKLLESWYGKKFDNAELERAGGFDMEKLLGRPAILNIQHSADGKYANIVGINPLMKGTEPAPQHYPSRFFTLSNPDADVWAQMSKGTRKFIGECEEVKKGQVTLPTVAEKPKTESASSESPF